MLRHYCVLALLLPCATAFAPAITTRPYHLPSVSRYSGPAVKSSPATLRVTPGTRVALRMVAAAPLSLPSADELKTSQLAQLASMTGGK